MKASRRLSREWRSDDSGFLFVLSACAIEP
jgi:hypothetical protein